MVGDKVRIKAGVHSGQRGFVKDIDGGDLLIQLESGPVRLRPTDITNFSLAARKAWITEPDRAVGRRKGSKLKDRVTVTFRLDRETWELFEELEEAGLISDRNGIVNEWILKRLSQIRERSCPRK